MNPIIAGAGIEAAGGLITSALNIGQARQQMRFQERMSSTAYQRAMQDMKAAGLNPMMMYSKGGGPASTPTGASANLDNAAKGAGAAGIALSQNKIAQQQLTNATEEVKAKVNLLNAEAELARKRAETEGGRPGEIAQNIQESIARIEKMAADKLGQTYKNVTEYWHGKSAEQDYHHDKAMGALWERAANVVINTLTSWDKITPPTWGDVAEWFFGHPDWWDAQLKKMFGETDKGSAELRKKLTDVVQEVWQAIKAKTKQPTNSARTIPGRNVE